MNEVQIFFLGVLVGACWACGMSILVIMRMSHER
jgi:hypothetical protein